MKRGFSLGFFLQALALAMGGGTAAAAQWKKTFLLRGELTQLQLQAAELQRLQAENARLKARQLPAGELQKLREEYDAVMRLRAELEALQGRTQAPAAGR